MENVGLGICSFQKEQMSNPLLPQFFKWANERSALSAILKWANEQSALSAVLYYLRRAKKSASVSLRAEKLYLKFNSYRYFALTVTQHSPGQRSVSLGTVSDSIEFHSALSWISPSLHSALFWTMLNHFKMLICLILSFYVNSLCCKISWHCTFKRES